DLGRSVRCGRTQWTLVGRRQVGARLPVYRDRHPLVQNRVVAHLGGGWRRGEVAGVHGVADSAVGLVEVDQLTAVGELDRRAFHCPDASTTTSSPTRSLSCARASPLRPESVMSTSASSRGAIVAMPTVSHLVWSAMTTRRRAAATRSRLVPASIRFGVVKPVRALIPCTPRKSTSTLSEPIAASATGPASASDGVRMPPVRTTV